MDITHAQGTCAVRAPEAEPGAVPLGMGEGAPAPCCVGEVVPRDLSEILPDVSDDPSQVQGGPPCTNHYPHVPQTSTNWRSQHNREVPKRLTATQLGFNVEAQAAEASSAAQEALCLGDVQLIREYLGAADKGVTVDSKDFNTAYPFQSSMESHFRPHYMVCGLCHVTMIYLI
jgi:hypothetical protein